MAKNTLLQFINQGLDIAEFEQVTAITDTPEAVQVLDIFNRVIKEISLEFWWDFLETDVTLTGLTTVAAGPFPVQATVNTSYSSITELYKQDANSVWITPDYIKKPEVFRRTYINATPGLDLEPSAYTFQNGNTLIFNNAIAATFTAGNFLIRGIQQITPYTTADGALTTPDTITENWDLLISLALMRDVCTEITKDLNLAAVFDNKYLKTLTNLIERGVTGTRDETTTMEQNFGKQTQQGGGYRDKHCPIYYR